MNSSGSKKTYIITFIVGFIIMMIIFVSCGVFKGRDKNSYSYKAQQSGYTICQSCGRKFTDSANKNSIRSTNMCQNCYNNLKAAKDSGIID